MFKHKKTPTSLPVCLQRDDTVPVFVPFRSWMRRGFLSRGPKLQAGQPWAAGVTLTLTLLSVRGRCNYTLLKYTHAGKKCGVFAVMDLSKQV